MRKIDLKLHKTEYRRPADSSPTDYRGSIARVLLLEEPLNAKATKGYYKGATKITRGGVPCRVYTSRNAKNAIKRLS